MHQQLKRQSGIHCRFRPDGVTDGRFLVREHTFAAAGSGFCRPVATTGQHLSPQNPAFCEIRELASAPLASLGRYAAFIRPKARSNIAKPESLPDIPSTQRLAWLMMRAALYINSCITVLMRRRSAAFLSGLSLSCSVC